MLLNSTSFNGLLNSMVDNDFVVAKNIAKGQSAFSGPRTIASLDSKNEIDALPHGEKFYTKDTGVDIYRKYDTTM